jgi:hypothetical protein
VGRSWRRSLTGSILALLVVAACPTVALARAPQHQSSDNWAGYAVTAHSPFAAVDGQWVQPAATCDQRSPTYSSFWIGLGGFNKGSQALEQIGTEADCGADGTPRSSVWYELVPAPMIKTPLHVRPGDRLAARVSVRGQRATLRIENLTTGLSFTRTRSMQSPDTGSAEWIAEAPSECVSANQCQPLPLTNFGSVSFSRSTATTRGWHAGTISDPAFTATAVTLDGGPSFGPQPIADRSASRLAIPGELSPDGSSFTVRFKRQPTPPAPLAAGDHIRHGPHPAHRPLLEP